MSSKRMVQQKRSIESRGEEDYLAKTLFGNSAGFPHGFEDSDDGDDGEFEAVSKAEFQEESIKKPVWQDEDDEIKEAIVNVPLSRKIMHIRKSTDTLNHKITLKEYEGRLRQLFYHSSGATPAWSQPTRNISVCESKKIQRIGSDDDDLENALREVTAFTGKCVTSSSQSLTKGVISVKRLNNVVCGHRFEKKPIRALQFHPTHEVLMCAGENGLIDLFKIGLPETEDAFLQNIHFKAFPITSASFTADGSKIIVGSKKKESLFCYDLLDAKVMQMRTPYEMTKYMGYFSLSSDGKYIAVLEHNEVHILTSTSLEYVGVLTAAEKISSAQFLPNDSSVVFALGGTVPENGQVFVWNIRKAREQQTFHDEGSVRGTVVRISENGQYIACGSNTGIVNLYDSADAMNSLFPKPVKVLDNLTTTIDYMAFNNDSQILSVSSSVKFQNNSIRLMHVGSRTVYTNFPPRNVRLGKVTVFGFSPGSAYMGIGDDRGFLSLLRLSHFTAY